MDFISRMFMIPTEFRQQYIVQSSVMAGKQEHVEQGGKIILPHSALLELGRLNIQWPVLFQITNSNVFPTRVTHSGVLEFSSQEGRAILPLWMMKILSAHENDRIQISYMSLPRGEFVRLQPHSHDAFSKLVNPKAVLEIALRNFAALTKDQDIQILYLDEPFSFRVLDVKPDAHSHHAISVIETDLDLDLAPALDAPPEPAPSPFSSSPSSSSHPLQDDFSDLTNLTPVLSRPFQAPNQPLAAPVESPSKPAFDPFAGPARHLRTGRIVDQPSSSTTTTATPVITHTPLTTTTTTTTTSSSSSSSSSSSRLTPSSPSIVPFSGVGRVMGARKPPLNQ